MATPLGRQSETVMHIHKGGRRERQSACCSNGSNKNNFKNLKLSCAVSKELFIDYKLNKTALLTGICQIL